MFNLLDPFKRSAREFFANDQRREDFVSGTVVGFLVFAFYFGAIVVFAFATGIPNPVAVVTATAITTSGRTVVFAELRS